MSSVIWHDIECGAYSADLPLWRQLAGRADGPILEIGAGTGRVALDLARRGHRVIALERDPVLAAELRRRAGDLQLEVICADACDFELAGPVGLVIVPMQTVQLLKDRSAFLRCAATVLAPGAEIALALLGSDVQPFEVELAPDVAVISGVHYASAPSALRATSKRIVLERRRTASAAGGACVSRDVVELQRLDPATLAAEAPAAALRYVSALDIAPTDQHAGSVVVLLEAGQ
jgi:SAM-dependent methyltransferase